MPIGTVIYLMISTALVLASTGLCIAAHQTKTKTGYQLTAMITAGICVSCAYLASINIRNYFWMSVCSSLYFISISTTAYFMLQFAAEFTHHPKTPANMLLNKAFRFCLYLDICVFLLNPFFEIAVTYLPLQDANIAFFSYDFKPMFILHLAFCYAMCICALYCITRKIVIAPAGYKRPYVLTIVGLSAVLLTNCVFLFVPTDSNPFHNLDVSLWMYYFVELLLFLICFRYMRHGMLNGLRSSIFNNISQGILLFDYQKQLTVWNSRAAVLIDGLTLETGLELDTMLQHWAIKPETIQDSQELSFQHYEKSAEGYSPIRCDYKPQRNDKGQITGYLFVLSESVVKTDVLTGFQMLDSFRKMADRDQSLSRQTGTVVITDINGLSDINSTQGRSAGDLLVMQLAYLMKTHFPADSQFIRGYDAQLIAICYHKSEEECRKYLDLVTDEFNGNMQGALCPIDSSNSTVQDAINSAIKGLRTKKLLDRRAKHSDVLNSLNRALMECDSTTEEHVRRTQQMGMALGTRLGLSDVEQSNLSLLCIMHDIGKIGIPLEILNKPGRLTDAEWKTLQTHVYKGYQIAMSSEGLNGIADMILHHHERWDGKGYPDGLSKECIPLLSRIIAVVDAYDAMTNDRVYRAHISEKAAREELRKCAGSQFDPAVTAEFLRMLEETNPTEEAAGKDAAFISNEDADTDNMRQLKNTAPRSESHIHMVNYSAYQLGGDNRIIAADERFSDLTGYTQQDIESGVLSQFDLLPAEDLDDYLVALDESINAKQTAFFEHRLRRKDGEIVPVMCYGRLYYDSAAREERSEIIVVNTNDTAAVQDVYLQAEKDAETRLAHWENKYRRDSLTGLLTHEAFQCDVEEKLLSKGYCPMMIMMDLDHFKEYNDSRGHHAGDGYLICVSRSIKAALRSDDLACRMGGDEFAAMLFFDKAAGTDTMLQRADQIFRQVSQELSGLEGASVSMGVALGMDDSVSFTALYEQADRALYQAKRAGGHQLMIHEKT
ncbi:MAG: diguanylate cyclase [Clostridia bacterium]|nr:diguanylate cyclase [Clostridia bacterium]